MQELRAFVARKLGSGDDDVSENDAKRSIPTTIAFMEGFLLYSPPSTSVESKTSPLRPVHDQIHLPIFLPASYTSVKTRREGRSGYVTIGPAPEEHADSTETEKKRTNEIIDLEQEDDRPPQNFWVDPPGYVDDIVWPRYVEDHAWLLVADESVEGNLIKKVGEGVNVRTDAGVRVAPGKGDIGMEDLVRWAVEEIVEFYRGQRG